MFAGAFLAVALAEATSAGWIYALAIVACIGAASATRASRWYVTSAFTTLLVLSLLAFDTPSTEAVGRVNERVAETALGVCVALLFGTVLPRLTVPTAPSHTN